MNGIVAEPYSWPASAFIFIEYVGPGYLKNGKLAFEKISFISSCGGFLIDRKTLLSAAHCFSSRIPIKHETYDVYPGEINGSMVNVFVGVHDISYILLKYYKGAESFESEDDWPKPLKVKEIITVTIYFFLLVFA